VGGGTYKNKNQKHLMKGEGLGKATCIYEQRTLDTRENKKVSGAKRTEVPAGQECAVSIIKFRKACQIGQAQLVQSIIGRNQRRSQIILITKELGR